MTQAELAEETGVTTDHISHVEIGSGTISLPLLIEICKLLGVTPNDILAGEYQPIDNSGEEKPDVIFIGDLDSRDKMLIYHLMEFFRNRK